MIHLYVTADYELYFGGNQDSPAATLLAPTAQLLACCQRLAIPLTLFADVACLWRYRQWGEEGFVCQAEEQLQQAIKQGHDVQPHLHPHWLATRQQGKGYLFPPNTFALGTLATEEETCQQQIHHLVQESVNYLEALLRPVQPDYRCRAFRAGGYRLDPRREMILQALADHGIKVDSSIIPGFHHPATSVDFRQEPCQAGFFLNHTIFEVPIAAAPLSPRQAWWLGIGQAVAQFGQQPASRGQPWSQAGPPPSAPPWKLAYWRARALLHRRFARLELCDNPRLMEQVLASFLAASPPAPENHVALICHPKGIFPHHLQALETFLRRIKATHGSALKLATLGQLAARLEAS